MPLRRGDDQPRFQWFPLVPPSSPSSTGGEDDRFAPPELVRLFIRTPEEVALANERLRELHAPWLGVWRSDDEDQATMSFEVSEGFLILARDERDPAYLGEPAEDGTLSIIGADYVTFTPEKNDAGEIEAIQIDVAGEPRTRLVRDAD